MVLLAFLASALLMAALVLQHSPASLDRQRSGWPVYVGLLTFIPLALLRTLVLPAPAVDFLFWLRLHDFWWRDLLLSMVVPALVACFVPLFGQKRLDSASSHLYFGIVWSLCAMEQVVSSSQLLDSTALFVRPLAFACTGLVVSVLLHHLLLRRKAWPVLVLAALFVTWLGSLVVTAWVFHEFIVFVPAALALIALAVLAFAKSPGDIQGLLGRLMPGLALSSSDHDQ